MSKVYIIAEAGVNHNGSVSVAIEMIDAAVNAGADAVKFQTFKAEKIVTSSAPKADYQEKTTVSGQTQYEMIKSLELNPNEHLKLMDYCASRAIRFLSTGFDLDSLDFLYSIGLDTFKIPSGEITNLPLLRKVGGFGKNVILSTGMADMNEVQNALNILTGSGTMKDNITVLQCTTMYPARPADVNLRAMISMREEFGVKVGYSDHTKGIEIPIAAAALGASVIEKHFTLDRSMTGPDHKASVEPGELKEMIRCIRNVEKALGDGIKVPAKSELQNRDVIRKSIVASANICKGQPFTPENITVKRPGSGISPLRIEDIIGKKAARNFTRDELIEL